MINNYFSSTSALLKCTYVVQNIFDADTFKVILSAFFGGLFAGLFSNYFEVKRKTFDKRSDKYYENRSTLVQIEHELIPLRVNTARNLTTIENALSISKSNKKIRVILRFYNLSLTSGLSLKLQNLDFINGYSAVYSLTETLNSDISYILGMIDQIKTEIKEGKPNDGLISSYTIMLDYLKKKFTELDSLTLKLLSRTKLALEIDDKEIKENFIKTGAQIIYKLSAKQLNKKQIDIEREEKPLEVDARSQFFAPYMDILTIENDSV